MSLEGLEYNPAEEDLCPADVRVQPTQGYKADSWKFGYEGDHKWLI